MWALQYAPKNSSLSFVVLEISNCHVTQRHVLIGPHSSRAVILLISCNKVILDFTLEKDLAFSLILATALVSRLSSWFSIASQIS